ncbi:flagellar basal-body MS-ring/collar protein FliF [Paenirhodobacter sp.]|uniref:flagellar basal-body MS-ring/collar protein FliF n=1 Tax=Paenirhodobacter sp. TaxID=1965326 RepID=UPI003B3C13FE
MQQILASWGALDTRRRTIVAGATILVFAAILALSGMASRPTQALLYAGLDPSQAGEIIAALDQRGAAYEVRGDSLYVDAAQRDQLRMTLASEGLPKSGGNGYELLDSLSGFGTTSQMFDAAYWRAKEGELARTILSNSAIRSARVHIAAESGASFRGNTRPTASVTVTMNQGALTPSQAKALQFLVASAVAGMKAEDVSVIDSAAGLISTGSTAPGQIGEDRSADLRKNVERLLEARVGYGNAVVEVSVQTVSEREAITERRFDPQSRVAISVDSTETSKKADSTKGGSSVTVASNLPDGNAANNSGQSQSQATESRERTNYEVSETTREIVRNPGDIKRITVAVLVDGVEGTDAKGQTAMVPRSQEELESLKELVASAVGFDESRGDVVTIRSMPFQQVATQGGTEVSAGLFASQAIDVMKLAQLASLVVVALILGLFVMRPLLSQRHKPAGETVPALPGENTIALPTDVQQPAPTPTIVPVVAPYDIQMPGETDAAAEGETTDPVTRLKRLIEQRQGESVEILRNWMEKSEGRT